MLPPDGLDRLAKLIPLLGSDKDGEVVATVRAIERTLKAAGKDWHALVEALVGKRSGWAPDSSFRASFRQTTPTTGRFNYANTYGESEQLFEGPEDPRMQTRKFGLPLYAAERIEPWSTVGSYCLHLDRTIKKKHGGRFLLDWQKHLFKTMVDDHRQPTNQHVQMIEHVIARLHQARDAQARAEAGDRP